MSDSSKPIYERKLADLTTDERLAVDEAIALFESNARPRHVIFPNSRSSDSSWWFFGRASRVFEDLDLFISTDEIAFTTTEGFAYTLPILLAVGMFEPNTDFVTRLFEEIAAAIKGGQSLQPYAGNTTLRKLLELARDQDPELNSEFADEQGEHYLNYCMIHSYFSNGDGESPTP